MLGVPAKVLRIKVPLAEVAISYQLDTTSPTLRLKGKIEEFNPGTNRPGHRDQRGREQGDAPDPVHRRHSSWGPWTSKIREPEHRRGPRPAQTAGLRDPFRLAARPHGMDAGQSRPDGGRPRAADRARTGRQAGSDHMVRTPPAAAPPTVNAQPAAPPRIRPRRRPSVCDDASI